MTNFFSFEPDMAAKQIHVVREFNAPVEKIWQAFTDPELVVKWIAPKPWRAETKTWDFKVGGVSLYAMIGPEGQKQWVYAEFTAIEAPSAFSTTGMFCDADGNPVKTSAKSYKDTKFSPVDGNRSRVDMMISFEEESILKWFVEGGFKEGTIMTLNQLDELLA